MASLTTLLLPLFLAECIAAHGFVSQVIIDDQSYAGNIPGKYQGPSPIRMISTIDPVKGANNTNLNCGQDAQLAQIVAPANPASNVTFQWSGGADGGQNWPHNVGPIMTYMASCGTTSCAEFNGSIAEWFKIDELGQTSNGSAWYQQDFMYGDSYTVTLPVNTQPGGYLIRHEIISLQLAASPGGAEFYPSCTQVQISGSGTGTPNDTVQFPGGYSDTAPSIYVPDVYNPGFRYVFPGPPISNLAYPGDGEITPHLGNTATFPAASAIASGSGAVSVAPVQSGTASASESVATWGASATTSGTEISPSASLPSCRLQTPSSVPASVPSESLNRRSGHHRSMRRGHW